MQPPPLDNIIISVVSPVYRAEKIIPELVKRIKDSVESITTQFEIVLVDDGSPDKSWLQVEAACKQYPFVKGIKLSRNFGQHYAITAGINLAVGNYIIVMDCDLQDNPAYIGLLYKKALEGNDIVYTFKQKREHSFFKNITASIFFRLFNYLSENEKTEEATKNVGSYSLLSRKAVDAFNAIKDQHRHYLMVLRNLGFTHTYVEIVHEKRYEGKSSYNFSRLMKHAVNGITSQSDKLLRISINLGLVIFLVSLAWAVWLIASYFLHGSQPGYTSLMVIMLLSTGLILMSIGITGIYIGKIFEQVKQRPLYFIDKTINI